MATINTKALHSSVVAMFAAFTATMKTDGADYKAVAATLKSAPLNDAEAVKALRDDLLTTFGEDHKDAAQIRINCINNARRVAYGGTKDGKAVRGKGHATMCEVVASVASVRELKKALAESVPEALKGASGGDRKSTGKKGAKPDKSAISLPKIATREAAFEAARKVLEFCRDKFVKPSETTLTEAINIACSMLK